MKWFVRKVLCIVIIFALSGALVYGLSCFVRKNLPENASGYLQVK